ncbi:aminopeptidase P family N-terminal domain-containing protein [Rhizobium sp. Nf11,1]|uniref:aminopeptidase P family N-terminal domain-containing protein n=2 Tax=unclassified Rhizobium TaxID=2613769 RepID=UPI003D33B471
MAHGNPPDLARERTLAANRAAGAVRRSPGLVAALPCGHLVGDRRRSQRLLLRPCFQLGKASGGRARQIMHRHKFDALLVSSPPNVRYFTGFDSQFWESPTRPWFVVVPLEGDPVAVIPEIGAPEMALTWMKDIRTWQAQPGQCGH